MSKRKPFNEGAGYIASRKNPLTGNWVVIYRAAESGIDVGSDKYAVVCEEHGAILGRTSVPNARPFMKLPEFCEECMKIAKDRRMLQ